MQKGNLSNSVCYETVLDLLYWLFVTCTMWFEFRGHFTWPSLCLLFRHLYLWYCWLKTSYLWYCMITKTMEIHPIHKPSIVCFSLAMSEFRTATALQSTWSRFTSSMLFIQTIPDRNLYTYMYNNYLACDLILRNLNILRVFMVHLLVQPNPTFWVAYDEDKSISQLCMYCFS